MSRELPGSEHKAFIPFYERCKAECEQNGEMQPPPFHWMALAWNMAIEWKDAQ